MQRKRSTARKEVYGPGRTPGGRGENERVLGRPPRRQAPGDVYLIRPRVLARNHHTILRWFHPPNQTLMLIVSISTNSAFGKVAGSANPVKLGQQSNGTVA